MARVSKATLMMVLDQENLAKEIGVLYDKYRSNRQGWERDRRELVNYIFAIDTTDTSNKNLPWKNSTTLPKLTQIRDNLHANYMQALFPHDDWFKWQAMDRDSATKEKATIIEQYIKNKIRGSKFKEIISRCLYDYIDYGNCFAEVAFVREIVPTGFELEDTNIYSGPKVNRISPFDIIFDITARDFQSTPKITRSLISLGDLKYASQYNPDFAWVEEVMPRLLEVRSEMSAFNHNDVARNEPFTVQGFGNLTEYFESGMVELLEFEGDIYDRETNELLINRKIIVLDRRLVGFNEPIKSWLGRSNKEHAGWRFRPDNLMAMGPLDNLVGMQYRVDHLENLKADVFDQIAHPVVYQRGYVEDWEWGPGERIYGDEESMVQVLAPDATALGANFEIQNLLFLMEEMAGAPKQAMGIRTPGEKTAFEVSTLQNASSRIFQHKVQFFEEHFLEPLLNQMLAAARQNFQDIDVIPVVDDQFGSVDFRDITKDDISGNGKLVPIGARHFARQSQLVQDLVNLTSSPLYADPAVQSHISGIKLAEAMEELLGLDKFDLVSKDVRIAEAAESQQRQEIGLDQNVQNILNREDEEVI